MACNRVIRLSTKGKARQGSFSWRLVDHDVDSNRYSMASTSDINHPPSGPDSLTSESSPSVPYGATQRHDSTGPLVLPPPLTTSRVLASASTVGMSRSSEDVTHMSDVGSVSNQRLVPSPQDQYSDYSETQVPRYPQFDVQVARAAGTNGGVLRNATISNHYPGETQNPFRPSEVQAAAYDEQYGGYTTEPEEHIPGQRQSRGVSLSDNGPVPPPEGVRRVARPRRPPSQTPQNRYSRSSTFNLPPGAAPPQPGSGYGTAY